MKRLTKLPEAYKEADKEQSYAECFVCGKKITRLDVLTGNTQNDKAKHTHIYQPPKL